MGLWRWRYCPGFAFKGRNHGFRPLFCLGGFLDKASARPLLRLCALCLWLLREQPLLASHPGFNTGMEAGLRYLKCIVDEERDGARVYDVLRCQLGVSDGSVRRAKRVDGGILCNGVPTWTNGKARAGAELAIAFDGCGLSGSSSELAPDFGALAVVYVDEDILVLEKPAGIVMYPSPGHVGNSLANRVQAWLVAQGRHAGIHAAHRLDRDTSGLVLFAFHSFAKERLQAQLHGESFMREYEAICEGWPEREQGVIDAPIGRVGTKPNRWGITLEGKPALTRYRVIKRGRAPDGSHIALIRLRLETGRTHQIRVHMGSIGHPLLGDAAYGSALGFMGRPALHSALLNFRHPVSGEECGFTSALPEDMAQLLCS